MLIVLYIGVHVGTAGAVVVDVLPHMQSNILRQQLFKATADVRARTLLGEDQDDVGWM